MTFFFIIFLWSRLILPLQIEERKNLYGPHGDFINKLSNLETAGAVATNDSIFFILQNGEIYQYYNQKFKKILNLERIIICSPKIYNNVLYIGTASGDLVTIYLKTYEILWEQKLFNKPIISPPAAHDEFIVLKSPEDDLLLINPENGETIRILKNDEPHQEYNVLTFSSPIIDKKEGIIFYGTQTGGLNAVDFDLKMLWKIKLKEGISSFTFTPIDVEDMVIISLGGKYLFGAEKKTGKKLWEKEMKNMRALGKFGDKVVAVSQDGIFTSIEAKTGRKIMEKNLKIKEVNEILVLEDGEIVAGSSSGDFYVIGNGFKILQKIKLEGGISSPIAVSDRAIGVLTDAGNAYVFSINKDDR